MAGGPYTFAVVPKRTNSPYWQVVRDGCEVRAGVLSRELSASVACLFVGPPAGGPETEANQAAIVEDLIDGKYGPIDGLALAAVAAPSAERLIAKAAAAGVRAVTFDTDAPDSERLAYIGTDNAAMGRELGRVLLQIDAGGGTFGMVGAGGSTIQQRYDGVREALLNSGWIEVADSPKDCGGNDTLAVQQMHELVDQNVGLGAIIPVGAWPMNDAARWRDFVDGHRDVITVVGDSLQGQIDLMGSGYANALVGQLPFEMGKFAMDRLLEVRKSQEAGLPLPFEDEIFPTSFLDIVNIPQDLPPLVVDMNYIGNWAILGYTLFGVIALLSSGFFVFTVALRGHRVIRKSQPEFLLMVCVGCLIAGSAIVPLSFDDEKYSVQACSVACMAAPWLLSIGFVTAYSALFSKIWRVNKILNNPNQFARVKVTPKDVLAPFAVLMTTNIFTLVCWTVINPLVYERSPSSGTDQWNRVYKSYYGQCVSSGDAAGGYFPYLVILVITNFVAVAIANVQAYRARYISVEFQESKYVGLASASLLQALIIGAPVLLLISEDPRAFYIVASILVFVTCAAILLLLFIPKVLFLREHDAKRRANATRQANAESTGAPDHLKFDIMAATRREAHLPYLRHEQQRLGSSGGSTAAGSDLKKRESIPLPSLKESDPMEEREERKLEVDVKKQ